MVIFRRGLAGGVFAILLALAFGAHSQSDADARVRQLAPGVFCWMGDRETRRQTNVGWVVFRDYVLVIDANFPWGARDILPQIRRTTDKPVRFVFNTHYHADHSYGNTVFVEAGAAIVASQESAAESLRKGLKDAQNQAKGSTEPLEHPSVRFSGRLVFDDGDKRVELTRAGPAHTAGDSVAYLPKEKILFAGDLAVNWTYGNNVSDPDADHDNWIRVLDSLAQMPAAIVVPAHGALGSAETLRGQRAYLAAMVALVDAALAGGKTIGDVVRQADLTRHLPFGADPARTASSLRSLYRRRAAAR